MAELARPRRTVPALLVALLGALAFLPSVPLGRFLGYDDDHYVQASPAIARGEVARILDPLASRADLGEEYLPVRDLTWVLTARTTPLRELHDANVAFDDPRWDTVSRTFRAHDLALYALACALAFLFLEELTRDAPLAFLAAAFFAVHPVHAESVSWIASRKDVLSGALGFGALLLHLRGRVLAAAGVGLLAMLSKSTLTCLPVLAFLVDLAGPSVRRERARIRGVVPPEEPEALPRAVLRAVPLALVAGIVVLVAIKVGARTGIQRPAPPGGLATVFATDLPILVRYVAASFAPFDLRVHYAIPLRSFFRPEELPFLGTQLATVSLVALLAAIAARTRPVLLAFAAGWFALGLLPVLNLVPFVQWIADRYLFVPVLGPCLILAWACTRLRARPALSLGLALLVLVAFGTAAVARGLDFTTAERLFRRNVALEPGNPVARHQLGRALLAKARTSQRRGEPELARAQARLARDEETRALALFNQTGVIWAGPLKEVNHSLAECFELEGDLIRAVRIERNVFTVELAEGDPRSRERLLRLGRKAEAPRLSGLEHDLMLVEAARCHAAGGDAARALAVLDQLEKRNPELVVRALDEAPELLAVYRARKRP